MARKKAVEVQELDQLDGEGLLDQLVSTGIKPRGDKARDRAKELLENFVAQLITDDMVVAKGVIETIDARIADIDQMLSRQVNAVLHHPEFQALEASWRGLHKLVFATETGESMQIRVLNAGKKELAKDFEDALEFTESALWKAIYKSEYNTYGGDPYGALIGDFTFGKNSPEVALLTHISQVAAAAHAPFITAPAPEMFDLESFNEIGDPRDLGTKFGKNNPENTKWLSFREQEDARFLAMTLPRVLRRLPYSVEENPIDSFVFNEETPDHDQYCWGNAAFDYAQRLTDAFAQHGWCVAIKGPQGGGMVEDLPIHTFKTARGDTEAKCPTEILIDDDRDNELAKLGFIGLLNSKKSDYATFFSGNSVQRPKEYDKDEATANARLSAQIPYLMATSRIAHYLKAIGRDLGGSFMSRKECEDYLDKWIKNYVLDMDDATQEAKAARPLREARVEVFEDKARPGCYQAVAHLRPHFQLEELEVSLRLVAELPPPAAQ